MIRKLLSVVWSLLFAAIVVFVGVIVWHETFGHLVEVFTEHREVRQTVAELEQAAREPSDTLGELLGEGEQVRHYLGDRVLDEVRLDGHFHHINLAVVPDARSRCVACHGDLPHSEDPDRRAFWNMHAYTIGCETCHVRLEGDSGWAWYDRETGGLIDDPVVGRDPAPFTAKLIPLEQIGGGLQRVDSQARLDAATAYAARAEGLSEEQRKAELEPLHDHLSEQARTCSDCHAEESELPLRELGYPAERIEAIVGTEAIRMLEGYGTFHVFDIERIRPEREPEAP
jgi:hypothetical protein